jgi:catechol 2,3-dioxygenase-like lactoylglutathione lyase family enzyme
MNLFYNTIVFVADMGKSRDFYERVIGLKIELDYSVLVIYENRLAIHEGDKLLKTVYGAIPFRVRRLFGRNNLDIYFETDDLEGVERALRQNNVKFIHPIKTMDWGQRVLRCFDPDGHIVEIGDPLHFEHLKKKGGAS